MARRGLNCTLSYHGGGGKGLAYRVRVSRLATGFEMLAQESQGRTSRAFYPYETFPSKFAITVDLIGDRERRSFNHYLMNYAHYILNPTIKGDITPQMRVEMPSRGFVRVGIPTDGIEFGTHLGSMVWQPTVVFEVSQEPGDLDEPVAYTKVKSHTAGVNEPMSKYFYPTTIQLHGDQNPAVQAAVLGGSDAKEQKPVPGFGGATTADEFLPDES